MSKPACTESAPPEAGEKPAAAVPARHEVPLEATWDLTALFADDAAWEKELEGLDRDFPGIETFRGQIGLGPRQLLDALEFEKAIEMRLEKLNQYAALRASEDSSATAALAMEARLQGLLTRLGAAFSFVAPEIQAIPDPEFLRRLEDPCLAEWLVPLKKLRRRKPHTLSPSEERLLALGASALAGHQETFSQLTNVDMRFGTVRNDAGEEVELTQSSFSSLLVQRRAEVRKDAFHRFYQEFSDHRFTLAASLASSVRAGVFHARARNFPSAIEAALFGDDVPVEVYDNLVTAVRGRLEPLFRYFEIRRRALGLGVLHHYDTYVPLVAEIQTRIPWQQAVDKVLAALRPLGAEYCSVLADGLGPARWCDRYENRGKRSGAFSYGTFQSPPYILMNYKPDVFAEVYTLAHEAGHSMHSYYSSRAQSFQNYHYPIFLAEVASTFNEVLLTGHLLQETSDPKMRAFLINRQIDDFRGTLYRQTMFAEFERAAHEIEEQGGALTLDSFRSVYRGLLEVYFGGAVTLDSELELECLRIPHFYSAFYVYKYATGLAAAVALANRVLESGDPSAYLRFLRAGGKCYPLDTLGEAGVDMRSPAPVHAALDHFAKRVDELEQLL